MGVKICKFCGIEKPLDAFYSEPRSKDGLTARCKACKGAKPKPPPTPARGEPDDPLEPLVIKQGEVYRRPAWHEWVYGGGRNPLLEVRYEPPKY